MAQPWPRDWRAAAFGLELHGRFRAPGIDGAGAPERTLPVVALERVDRADLPSSTGEVLAEQPLPRGSFRIARSPDGGHLLEHPFYGAFAVSPGGTRILCAPAEVEPWLWQRFLVAQPLPLASTLNGYEPLHAAGVVADGRAILVMGASGAGKSSLALHLAARGAAFLADDVAALESAGDGVLAHPGPPLAIVDERELVGLPAPADAWARLGSVDGEARVVVAGHATAAAPVDAVYLLKTDGQARAVELRPPELDLAAVLLGGTFNPYVSERERLARQLDVASRLAAAATIAEVRIPRGTRAADVAEALIAAR